MQTDPPKYKVIKTAENAWQDYALKATKNDGKTWYDLDNPKLNNGDDWHRKWWKRYAPQPTHKETE